MYYIYLLNFKKCKKNGSNGNIKVMTLIYKISQKPLV